VLPIRSTLLIILLLLVTLATGQQVSTGGGGGTGPQGPQGTLGNTTFSAITTHTFSETDRFNAWIFTGTSAPSLTLFTPPDANYWTMGCNGTTQNGSILPAGHQYQDVSTGGAITTSPVASAFQKATTSLINCYTFSTDGTTWAIRPSIGPTGATGATGATGTAGSNTSWLGGNFNNATFNNNAIYYVNPFSSAGRLSTGTGAESVAQYPAPTAGTVSNFSFWVTATTTASSVTATFESCTPSAGACGPTQCTSPSTISVSIPGASVVGSNPFIDNTHSCTFAAGDMVDLKLTISNGGAAVATLGAFSYKLVTQ